MSDIVERLRYWSNSFSLGMEAADEIEKLRAELKEARRAALEEVKLLVELYAKSALKCPNCGDICHDYYPDGCSGRNAYLASEEYKKIKLFEGEYSAMRYFQKHICRPEPMDMENVFKSLIEAIRALGEKK